MGEPRRFLVVDDAETWRSSLSRLLRRLDQSAVVDVAADFDQAVVAVERTGYDLVTVDLALPGSPVAARTVNELGLQVAMELRKNPQNRHSGLLVLTAYPTSERVRRALRECTASDFLSKDELRAETFIDAARAALRQCVFSRAEEKDAKRYRFEVNFSADRLLGARLTGPRSAEYPVDEPVDLETARFGAAGDALNTLLFTGRGAWRAAADALGKELLRTLELAGPIGRGLSAARAVAEKDSDLGLHFRGPAAGLSVPFELIKDEDHKPLCFRHLLTREVVGETGIVSRKSQRFRGFLETLVSSREPLRILIVGANSDGSIPAAEVEAESLASHLRIELGLLGIAYEIEVLLGVAATRSRVAASLSRCHLFHYAGHGRFDTRLPEVSGLVLADGTLSASDLYLALLESPLRMAFLSCCLGARTAQRVGRGDFYGMLDAFARADVPIVQGYRWTVRDDSALELAIAYHETLWRSLSPAGALLRARRELAGGTRGWDDETWASPVLLAHQQG